MIYAVFSGASGTLNMPLLPLNFETNIEACGRCRQGALPHPDRNRLFYELSHTLRIQGGWGAAGGGRRIIPSVALEL